MINAFIQGICGLISVLAYGLICEKFEKKFPNIKSNMGIIGAVLALPAMAETDVAFLKVLIFTFLWHFYHLNLS
jgi:hypothetical protein